MTNPPAKAAGDEIANASSVRVTDEALIVELREGRSVSVPLAWYPRLLHATQTERDDWRLIGGGRGVPWPTIEEDISVESLLAGRPSQERPASLQRRRAGRS